MKYTFVPGTDGVSPAKITETAKSKLRLFIVKNFIRDFGHQIINIHPSLLPKFKGLNTHKRVLKSKEKYSGCTVHYVSPALDSGKIILQKKIKISKNDNIKTLEKKILKLEHNLYPKAINRFLASL